MTIPELTKRLNQLAAQLEAGKLSYFDLLKMSDLSRELYEDLIVLKHLESEKHKVNPGAPEPFQTVGDAPPETVKTPEPESAPQTVAPEVDPDEKPAPEVSATENETEPKSADVAEQPPAYKSEEGNAKKHENPDSGQKNSVEKEEAPADSSASKQITLIDSIDEIRREEKSLNQRFAEQPTSLGEKFKKQPIHDLRTAIGINRKFRFIDSLFDKNREAFDRAIDNLNTCASMVEAKTYFRESLMTRFKWDENQAEVEELLDLVERRFL